jgi:hypothetical protein
MNIRQANGIGRVHVAKPQFRDLLRQAHQRRGLGHHHQGGQLHRLCPGWGTGTRTNHQRVALICGQGRVSTACFTPVPRVR